MYLASTKTWYLERVLYLIAGIMSLLGVSLGFFLSPWGFLLNVLVGLNLIIFASTGFCIMSVLLARLGIQAKCSKE
ncbi:YgaP-like transmembrane domain [Leptospira ryugenii]|nr:YgaP-like transmembrane domain [Leptospira ryugenii]